MSLFFFIKFNIYTNSIVNNFKIKNSDFLRFQQQIRDKTHLLKFKILQLKFHKKQKKQKFSKFYYYDTMS